MSAVPTRSQADIRAQPAAPSVLAAGAWLKNAACLVHGDDVQWSPLHGDLDDPQACEALMSSLRELSAQGRVDAVAHDLHPDYFSTRQAVALAQALGVPAIGVQHHHAHIAVVAAEHGLNGPVIGLALDGVGLGSDGAAWGGELLWVDGGRMERLGHLWPITMPGGDVAAREPWRMAAAVLHALQRDDDIERRFGPRVGDALAKGVRQMLARGVRSPMTSSTGRWFDAAAAALGLCDRQAHEAQAAIALQQHAQAWIAAQQASGVHDAEATAWHGPAICGSGPLDLRWLLARVFDAGGDTGSDAASDTGGDVGRLAAEFHQGLADGLARWATLAARDHDIVDVCLGGGCFLNPVLTERLVRRLQQEGLRVHRPQRHVCGDAALALGQAWVAAHQLAEAASAGAAPESPRESTSAASVASPIASPTAPATENASCA